MSAVLKIPKFFHKHFVNVEDLSKKDIENILSLTQTLESMSRKSKNFIAENKIIANLFFEPSTRTRLSFESAAYSLGAKVLTVAEPNTSSISKGETIEDTIKVVSNYCDLIVMRSSNDLPLQASAVSDVPVINAGSGTLKHPTQALTDLYAVKKKFNKLSNLNIAFVGDLKHSRAVNSLALAFSKFSNNNFFFISPEELKLSSAVFKKVKEKSNVSQLDSFNKILPELDIIYLTRLQRERFKNFKKFEKAYVLNSNSLKNVKKNLIIMHPLPRTNEIPVSLDKSKHSYYFEQAACGVPVREALLTLLLKQKKSV